MRKPISGRRGRPSLPGRRQQRGVAAVFAAIAIVALVISMLLGINIGRLYYAQRDLQRLASLAAIAGANMSSGCGTGTRATDASTGSALWNQVQSVILANNGNSGTLTGINGAAAVQVGWVNAGNGGSITDDSGAVHTVASDSLRHFVALANGDSHINAVRVNLSSTAPSILGSAFFPGYTPSTIYASASATQLPIGAFSIGSTTASLNTSSSAVLNPLLSGLLGSSVNLAAVDFVNLASTQISLANLMVAAGVNDLNSLLSLSSNASGLKTLLGSAANLVNPSAANLVTGLTLGKTQAATNVPLANLLGNVGKGLNPTVNDAAALAPSLNLLDLLQGLGQAAAAQNPNSFLTLSFSPGIPGVVSTAVYLSVQQPMQPGFGPVGATAQTAQVTLRLRISLDNSLLGGIFKLLQTLTLGLVSFNADPVNVGVDLQVAKAVGTLDSLICPTTTSPYPSAQVGVNANLVTTTVGTFSSGSPSAAVTSGNLLNISGTVLGLPTIAATVGLKGVPAAITLGSTAGAEAGPFKIYQLPTAPVNTTTQAHTYIYPACNSLGGSVNPCTNGSTDPNNPNAPIPSVSLLSGLSSSVASLVTKNNLSVVIRVAGIPVDLTALLDPLVSLLNTLLIGPLTSILDAVLNPLLNLLGLQVGSATVLMNSVTTGPSVVVTTRIPGSLGS